MEGCILREKRTMHKDIILRGVRDLEDIIVIT